MQIAPSDWADDLWDLWATGDEGMTPEVDDVDDGSVGDGVTAALV